MGKSCVRPTSRNVARPKCTRLVSLRGKLTRAGKAGKNHFTWDGKLGGHSLGPGTYELILTPSGGKPKQVKLKIEP